MEFEKAARIRDRIAAIKKISEKQKVVRAKVAEQDVFALVQSGGSHGTAAACFEVFRFSEGTEKWKMPNYCRNGYLISLEKR